MEFEKRECPKCGKVMRVVDGSQRTTRYKIWFTLQCPACLHKEQDFYKRKPGKKY